MIAIFIALLLTPFTLVKKIERLRFMVFLGVLGITIFSITFVIYYIISTTQNHVKTYEMNLFPTDWFAAAASVPNIILAFAYHMSFFPIFKGLKNSNDYRMRMASWSAVGFSGAAYLTVGILGYSLLGSTVQGNFLLSVDYATSNKFIYFTMNLGYLLSVFFAFTIMFFGCRNNFIALIQLVWSQEESVK
jgi:amino acid permease